LASELIAYCGLYCGACSFRVAFEENNKEHIRNMPTYYDDLKNKPLKCCPGCRLENMFGECAIRDCAMNKGIDYCSQCNDFPCEKSIRFNSDGKPHHEESIDNLKLLKEVGEEKWLGLMKEKWTCKCGARLTWYKKQCCKCEVK